MDKTQTERLLSELAAHWRRTAYFFAAGVIILALALIVENLVKLLT